MAQIQHSHIQGRADFFRLLGRLLPQARNVAQQVPGFAPHASIVKQLEAMEQWTADGREPTLGERKKIDLGRIIAREVEPEGADETAYYDELSELAFYFKHWLEDPDWLALDDADLATFYPAS